jgi:hypothetical protein
MKDEMGWVCSMYGVSEKCIQHFSWKLENRKSFRKLKHRRKNNIMHIECYIVKLLI